LRQGYDAGICGRQGDQTRNIYDRIHEVRMRFEVLKRDAEISCLQAIAAGEPGTAAKENLPQRWRRSTTISLSSPPAMKAVNSWHRRSWSA
jgi:hypothetical protein